MHTNFKRSAAIGIGIILVSLIGGALIINFWGQSLQQEGAAILQQRARLHTLSNTSAILAQYKDDAQAAAAYEKFFPLFLPGQFQLLDYPAWINGLSRVRQLDARFTFQGEPLPPSGGTPGYAPFSIDAGGTYDNLRLFIQDIESGAPKYLTNIISVEMSGSGGSYHAIIRGQVFYAAVATST